MIKYLISKPTCTRYSIQKPANRGTGSLLAQQGEAWDVSQVGRLITKTQSQDECILTDPHAVMEYKHTYKATCAVIGYMHTYKPTSAVMGYTYTTYNPTYMRCLWQTLIKILLVLQHASIFTS